MGLFRRRPASRPDPAAVWDKRGGSRAPWIVRALGTAFRRLILVLGTITFLLIVFFAWVFSQASVRTAAPLPSTFVLTLSLGDGAVEHPNLSGRYAFAAGGAPVFADVIATLDAAARDKRVKSLLVTLDGGDLNLAQIQEFRDSLIAFRKSGKPAYIYASSYGDPGAGLGTYYLASAFDEIWMQPLGAVSVAGLRAEIPFARAALDKIGVQPQFFARKEYKTLFESATGHGMSPESRDMLVSLVNDLGAQMVAGIAADKGIEPAAMARLVDHGFFTDQEAIAAGLVDRLEGLDGLRDKLVGDIGPKADPEKILVPYGRYSAPSPADKDRPLAAIVYIVGMIASSDEIAGGPEFVPAEDIAGHIRDAAQDDDVDVIVLRVDSPGGSPGASETIRRAVLAAQEKGKKVVVSMGETAASGGYWVSAPADRIFASPGTITGSIGVAGGKVVLQSLWQKLGVNWEYVQYGANAGMFSFNQPFTPQGEAAMNRLMDATYDAFITRVAEGRKMSATQVEAAARGRVWSGRQALQAGLVDELGGLGAALDYAARAAGASDRHALDIVVMPPPKSPVEMLLELMENQAQVAGAADAVRILSPLLKAYEMAAMMADPLTLEPLRIRP